jgi:hypothetical protein
MTIEPAFTASDGIDLLEWKHPILDLYGAIRAAAEPEQAWRHWLTVRLLPHSCANRQPRNQKAVSRHRLSSADAPRTGPLSAA